MPDINSLNPLAGANLGDKIGTFGSMALIVVIAVVILCLLGALIFGLIVKRQYWIRIHVFRLIGNIPTRVAVYSAKEVPFGRAGDKLWRVAGAGFIKFKAIKWMPVGKLQTAPKEFWYYIREDGEWINFILSDLNKTSKEMGVRFVQEDMRLQRLATERLLEQRLLDKTFWEKWGNVIMTVILFLTIAICMVIIFYQWGKIIEAMQPLVVSIQRSLSIVEKQCQITYNATIGGATSGLIPA